MGYFFPWAYCLLLQINTSAFHRLTWCKILLHSSIVSIAQAPIWHRCLTQPVYSILKMEVTPEKCKKTRPR